MALENEELDDAALFEQATSDEVVEQPEKLETEVVELSPLPDSVKEPLLDKIAEGDKPAVDDNAPQVPSWRVREINEEKRQLAAEVERIKAELVQLRQAPQQVAQPAPQAEKPAKPDPLLDPEGYAKSVRDDIREEMLAERRETSLATAHKVYKEEFVEAYKAAQQNIDPALKARMQQSRDPGETLIEWHREQKAKAEVGTDLNAYKQRLRDEALKDPEFRKAAMEAWRADTQPQANARPRVDLPPSLSGTSRSNAALRSALNDDISDQTLFEQTTG